MATRGRKSGTVIERKETILDSFNFISQSDKNKFYKKSETLKISQEELLNAVIYALNNNLIPINVETKRVVTVGKKEIESE